MQDKQDEVAAILAQIAMIAEDVNVIALVGAVSLTPTGLH
jgi:hypothetical protein